MSKDQGIESLRGLAIILLVALHASPPRLANVGDLEGAGLWAYVSYSVMLLRMPLFTVISGYVYALRPAEPDRIATFLRGKARRLLLPFVTISTLTFVLMKAIGAELVSWTKMWTIYVFPFHHFWFLQALIFVFLFVAFMERRQALRGQRSWLVVLVCTLILEQVVDTLASSSPHTELALSFLCLSRATYLLPFFLFGLGLRRFQGSFHAPSLRVAAVVVVLLAVTTQQLTWFGYTDYVVPKTSLLGMLAGLGATFLLIHHRAHLSNPGLARLGAYAYTIYLLHGFGLSVMVRIDAALGIEHPHGIFLTKLVGALFLPIAAEFALKFSPPARLAFLGLTTRK